MSRRAWVALVCLLALPSVLANCKAGDTGATGATGETGATGAVGATGATGQISSEDETIYGTKFFRDRIVAERVSQRRPLWVQLMKTSALGSGVGNLALATDVWTLIPSAGFELISDFAGHLFENSTLGSGFRYNGTRSVYVKAQYAIHLTCGTTSNVCAPVKGLIAINATETPMTTPDENSDLGRFMSRRTCYTHLSAKDSPCAKTFWTTIGPGDKWDVFITQHSTVGVAAPTVLIHRVELTVE